MRPQVRSFHGHHREQVLRGNLEVAAKYDLVHFVLLAFFDFINQQNLAGLALKIDFDLCVEVALFLEIVE